MRMGAEGKHFKCMVMDDKARTEAVFWNPGDTDPASKGEHISLVYEPEIHNWYGEKVQLIGRDVKNFDEDPDVAMDREYLVDAFLKLRSLLANGPRPVSYVEKELSDLGILPKRKMRTALVIFEELGVISRYGYGEAEKYRYRILSVKMNLETSPTYRRYAKRGK